MCGASNAAHICTAVLRADTIEAMEPLFEEYFGLMEIYGIDMTLQSARAEDAELAVCGV